jgi:hypothetical protein
MADTYVRIVREVKHNDGDAWLVVEPLTVSELQLHREYRGLVASGAVAESWDRWLFRRAVRAVEARRARGADPAVKPMHTVHRVDGEVTRVDCTIPRGQCHHCDGYPV